MKKSPKVTKILSIDTSCDETAVAVTHEARILSNAIASQAKLHALFGGVDPTTARREHKKLIDPTLKDALGKAGLDIEEIDAVAVTVGPGLAVALEVGVAKAKELAKEHKKPLIAVDHMEGHLLSPFAKDEDGNFGVDNPQFPALGLLVSGGHTELVLVRDFGDYELVGQTLDDAAGEAFDKVARILDLPYPGGPQLSRLAQKGDSKAFKFPVPLKQSGDLNFSYSGLKTACLYEAQKLGKLTRAKKTDFAASFQAAAVAHLVDKLRRAVLKYKPKMLLIGGGVINNRRLQTEVKRLAERFKIPLHIPFSNSLLTDNAAMIGVAAYFKAKRGDIVRDVQKVERVPDLTLEAPVNW
ncbi:tRNA (adenosine(37)-N6)-threonylcarbamoyltransferase complex transferase subunit TsaD [Candidatus Saccharibacteria bacterium]|nr:tRNA (adenosine(37)-N6)-threonylcarbamoyltransferase complex transferase subunit TsaD [Candidatus Saccharibacteria bacterium]